MHESPELFSETTLSISSCPPKRKVKILRGPLSLSALSRGDPPLSGGDLRLAVGAGSRSDTRDLPNHGGAELPAGLCPRIGMIGGGSEAPGPQESGKWVAAVASGQPAEAPVTSRGSGILGAELLEAPTGCKSARAQGSHWHRRSCPSPLWTRLSPMNPQVAFFWGQS